MPVLHDYQQLDDDSIENERANIETPFSHYKSIGKLLDARQLTP